MRPDDIGQITHFGEDPQWWTRLPSQPLDTSTDSLDLYRSTDEMPLECQGRDATETTRICSDVTRGEFTLDYVMRDLHEPGQRDHFALPTRSWANRSFSSSRRSFCSNRGRR